jgi:hypothetical protein
MELTGMERAFLGVRRVVALTCRAREVPAMRALKPLKHAMTAEMTIQ